jgi:hypothetical protein
VLELNYIVIKCEDVLSDCSRRFLALEALYDLLGDEDPPTRVVVRGPAEVREMLLHHLALDREAIDGCPNLAGLASDDGSGRRSAAFYGDFGDLTMKSANSAINLIDGLLGLVETLLHSCGERIGPDERHAAPQTPPHTDEALSAHVRNRRDRSVPS